VTPPDEAALTGRLPDAAADPGQTAREAPARARLASLLILQTASLEPDVQRLADYAVRHPGAEQRAPDALVERAPKVRPGECDRPAPGAGEQLFPVTLDGEPATLVFGAGSRGERPTSVLACADAGEVLARTVVRERGSGD
jgi:hypothetical protein